MPTIIACTQRRFKLQNDQRHWEIDSQGRPIKVINEKYWALIGVSVDPSDIPDDQIVIDKEIGFEESVKKETKKKKDKRGR